MADERDPKLTQHYRELGAEEPPRELDQAILAAAYRAADKPHAPLVTPAGRHRWYFAFGAAAILVLAVAVTVQMERQQPDAEAVTSAPPPASPEPQIPASQPPVEQVKPARTMQERPAQKANDAAKFEQRSSRSEAQETPPAAAARADRPPEQPAVPEAARQRSSEVQMQRQAADALGAQAEPPERWIERIVQLRKERKNEEAEKQLAEFRRRYPEYRIPEAALR